MRTVEELLEENDRLVKQVLDLQNSQCHLTAEIAAERRRRWQTERQIAHLQDALSLSAVRPAAT